MLLLLLLLLRWFSDVDFQSEAVRWSGAGCSCKTRVIVVVDSRSRGGLFRGGYCCGGVEFGREREGFVENAVVAAGRMFGNVEIGLSKDSFNFCS